MFKYRNLISFFCATAFILTAQISWAQSCGNVTYTGCCSGTTAKYCSGGVLKTKDCTKDTNGPNCGWVTTKNYYSCNATASKDPNGKYERDCSKLPPKADAGVTKKDAGTGPACGTITAAGCCDGSSVKYCSGGVLKTKSCVGSSYGSLCGWVAALKGYGCSKTATADPSGKLPLKCGGAATTDGGATKKDSGGSTVPCGAITAKGCCQGETVKVCKSSGLSAHDCSTNTANKKCGWDTSKQYYTCTSTGLSDPKGTYPKTCPASTKKDAGSVAKKDTGSTVKKDTGTPAVNPTPKDEDSCSVASGNSPSGLLLSLIT